MNKKYRDNEDQEIVEQEQLSYKKEEKYTEEFYFRILNHNRYILLYDVISNMSSDLVVSKIKAMNILDKNKPIYIEINSPGGSVADGMSIINAIEQSEAPIITIISGQACSMAALISIVGDKKVMYANSYWMQHSTADVVGDYIQYIKDRTKFLCEFEARTEKILKEKTKLSKMDIHKIRNGELWLNAEQSLNKGVIDKIIYPKLKKKLSIKIEL
jgi:ATP-dependent Clp protease protease subunit